MTPTIDAARRRVVLDPRDPAFFNDPYPAYGAIRRMVPAFFWEQYGFWCFARYRDVAALLRDRRFARRIEPAATSDGIGAGEPAHLRPFLELERHSLLELEPPDHTRLRNLVNRAFVSRRVERLAPRIAELTEDIIREFEARGSVELIDALATRIPVIVIAELLGVPVAMWRQLLAWSHAMVAMYQFGVTRAVEDGASEAARAFADFLRGYVRERRERPADDLIGQLLLAESEGARLSEAELVSTCVLLLNAGHEATVHAIGNGVKAMLEQRIDASRAFGDPARKAATIEELLRFDTPLHLFTRYALEDLDYEGVTLRRGERVGLLLGAANHDPERFDDPDRLDPERSPNPHLAFGGGIHFCVGAPLARLELAVALPILFERLDGLEIAAAPRYRDSFHFHGLASLPVRWRS
jgi:cytochrome P450